MQIVITLTVAEMYAAELQAKVPPRSVDMHRTLYHAKRTDAEDTSDVDEQVMLVLYDRPGDGWVGYSCKFVNGVPVNDVETTKRHGDKLQPLLVEIMLPPWAHASV